VHRRTTIPRRKAFHALTLERRVNKCRMGKPGKQPTVRSQHWVLVQLLQFVTGGGGVGYSVGVKVNVGVGFCVNVGTPGSPTQLSCNMEFNYHAIGKPNRTHIPDNPEGCKHE
jgi:hypothetical protein